MVKRYLKLMNIQKGKYLALEISVEKTGNNRIYRGEILSSRPGIEGWAKKNFTIKAKDKKDLKNKLDKMKINLN